MNFDDFVYLVFLIFSILFGQFYRQIENDDKKKKIGALVGFLIIFVVSNLHILHILITILVNALIILYIDKRFCHIISFIFSFSYLIFFRLTAYFDIPYPPSHTNLIQMILTLKLVGLAYEVNTGIKNARTQETDKSSEVLKLDIKDIFYYSFNYIGVLTGPYFKYKTFLEHLHRPFYKYDNPKKAAMEKVFPWIPIFSSIFLLTEYCWPIEYTQTEEFKTRSFLYRYWYIWPTFLNFRMRIYIGLLLSEVVCIMGGMGVYPVFCKSRPGHGPTENLDQLDEICKAESDLKITQYDYETVHSINFYGTELEPTLRQGMKNWNMTVQYWLATCIYKRFPNKQYRTFATMFVSGVWHGVHSGYYISVGMIPFGLIVEDIWVEILLSDEFYVPQKLGYIIMLFLKMQFFSYAALAFSLKDVTKIIHYYNLVYHWMIFFTIFMFRFGRYLVERKRKYLRNK
ncbi:lysophospholipid acyltransferase 7 [Anthonomus grandis grandis]|uniref:lysophospholipid acyltransferase 7 n=1 Tax=Anthonomus grandis grandis TaxID=2921223 RepID=UPI002165DC38|nr:lysophospholipid acyltransferase 7 [Anthonomus grandis grandis]